MSNRWLTIKFVRDIVRWDTWYDSKLPIFFVCMYYVALSRPYDEFTLITDFAGLVFILSLYACFGHVVNSFSDKSNDALAGKSNAFSMITERQGKILTGFFVGGVIFFTITIYYQQPSVVILLFSAYALAVFYSLPPVRFKERGVLGLIAPAIAQRTLPAIIVFDALMYWDHIAFILCILSTLIGLRGIIVHQIKDESADLRASVKTMATTKGTDYLRRLLIYIIFPLEVVFLLITMYLLSINFNMVGIIAVLYLLWLVVQILILKTIYRNSFSLEPYIVSSSIFSDFYNLYLPLTLAFLLVLDNEKLWIIILFTFVWLSSKLVNELKNIFQIVFLIKNYI